MQDGHQTDAIWRRNTIVGGLEIKVARRPGSETDLALEQSGWRWSNSIESWYHRDTPDNVEFARDFCAQARARKPR